MGHVIDGKRAASYLNGISEKRFRFTALKNPKCGLEDVLKTMEELKEVVFYCKDYVSEVEVRNLSDKMLESCVQLLLERKVPPESFQISTDQLNKYFLRSLLKLQDGEYREALRSLMIYESYGEAIFSAYPHLNYYKGLALYGLKDYVGARVAFVTYLEREPGDEVAHFYLGNVRFHLGDYHGALTSYLNALEIRGKFFEVLWNVAITAAELGDLELKGKIIESGILGVDSAKLNHIMEDPFVAALAIEDDLDVLDIPIFINSYNRLTVLKSLVDWLLEAGCRNIYILDNDSTYTPLLDYYGVLERTLSHVHVIRLGKNWGYKALWQSGVLESLGIETPYVYTDSDVVPCEECPKDFLSRLLDILKRYPLLKKVGLGLKTDDITYFEADKTRDMERRFYLHEMEPEVYFGAVDTTMALYRNYRHYNIYVSARTTGALMVRHMPWYYDYNNLPEDERYYMEHANKSASFVQRLKENRLL